VEEIRLGSHYRGNKEEKRALNAFINLTRASESLLARQARRLSDSGLTVSQWGVLEALYHLGPLCQKELGKKLLKSGGNITMVVTNLEKRALVRRHRQCGDRRFLEIQLTAKGRKLVDKILPRHVDGIVTDMHGLSADELAELRRLCRKLGTAEDDTEDQNEGE
jgi:MarR family 2-MHQ and catechol resistance regulon transcriptional repressor